MRIKHKANVRIAADNDMKNILFGPDDALAEVVIDTYLRYGSGSFNVAAAGTESLTLGDVDTIKGFYLYVDNDCKVYLNGSTDFIQLRISSGNPAKLFLEADITSVSVENDTAGVAIEGVYCFWGDVAP